MERHEIKLDCDAERRGRGDPADRGDAGRPRSSARFRARGPAGVAGLAPLLRAIKWGLTGFFAGLAIVVLLAVQLRRQDVISIRRLMVLVLVTALIAWFFGRIFFRCDRLRGVVGTRLGLHFLDQPSVH